MSETKSDGGPAFPTEFGAHGYGMSLRDWFAGQALAGLLAGGAVSAREHFTTLQTEAYGIADAMLAARDVGAEAAHDGFTQTVEARSGETVTLEFVGPAVDTSSPAARPHSQPSMTGEFCPDCAGLLVRSGTCMTCQSCGSTTGCS